MSCDELSHLLALPPRLHELPKGIWHNLCELLAHPAVCFTGALNDGIGTCAVRPLHPRAHSGMYHLVGQQVVVLRSGESDAW